MVFFSQLICLAVALLAVASAQSNNGQYTPWTPSTTQNWAVETTTTAYWTPTTTAEAVTTPYAWTSYTTVTSCYTENGVTITITTWVPCPCDGGDDESTTADGFAVGTTTETVVTTTTPIYSTYTSNGIVYVVPVSTAAATAATAGADIVVASDAPKSTEIEDWIGILFAVVLGGSAIITVVL